MIEVFVLLAILTSGYAYVRSLGLVGWLSPAVGYIVGLAILIDIGLIQVITGISTAPLITIGVALVCSLICLFYKQGRNALSHSGPLIVGSVVLVSIVLFLQHHNILVWTRDSFDYALGASLIADNKIDRATIGLLTARVLAVQLIHAPANLGDQFFFLAATPGLGLSLIFLLVWLSRRGLSQYLSNRHLTLVSCVGALLLATNHGFIWHAFYLNGHLVCAALILLIAGCGWLLAVSNTKTSPQLDARGLIALQTVAIPALIVARPEGSLYAALAILPTLLHPSLERSLKVLVVIAFTLATIGWNAFLIFAHLKFGQDIPYSVLVPLALGILAPGVLIARTRDFSNFPLVLTELLPWIALIAVVIVKPWIFLDSLHATINNVAFGSGFWGYSLILLIIMVVYFAVSSRASHLVFLRFPLSTFVPIAFILAFPQDGAYREGAGDSLNRMWMHIVPLAVLFVVATIGSDKRWLRGDG